MVIEKNMRIFKKIFEENISTINKRVFQYVILIGG